MIAGMVIRYEDYWTIPAMTWGDIILWKEAEAVRNKPKEPGGTFQGGATKRRKRGDD